MFSLGLPGLLFGLISIAVLVVIVLVLRERDLTGTVGPRMRSVFMATMATFVAVDALFLLTRH